MCAFVVLFGVLLMGGPVCAVDRWVLFVWSLVWLSVLVLVCCCVVCCCCVVARLLLRVVCLRCCVAVLYWWCDVPIVLVCQCCDAVLSH